MHGDSTRLTSCKASAPCTVRRATMERQTPHLYPKKEYKVERGRNGPAQPCFWKSQITTGTCQHMHPVCALDAESLLIMLARGSRARSIDCLARECAAHLRAVRLLYIHHGADVYLDVAGPQVKPADTVASVGGQSMSLDRVHTAAHGFLTASASKRQRWSHRVAAVAYQCEMSVPAARRMGSARGPSCSCT